jgi:predicted tellurium resistance membrane protein TerC
MSDLISGDILSTLAQVVMIDLVLAGDNAVVIGLAAAGLPDKQRKRAILIGIVTATVLRIVGATLATQLLQVLGLLFAGVSSCGFAGRCGASFARRQENTK